MAQPDCMAAKDNEEATTMPHHGGTQPGAQYAEAVKAVARQKQKIEAMRARLLNRMAALSREVIKETRLSGRDIKAIEEEERVLSKLLADCQKHGEHAGLISVNISIVNTTTPRANPWQATSVKKDLEETPAEQPANPAVMQNVADTMGGRPKAGSLPAQVAAPGAATPQEPKTYGGDPPSVVQYGVCLTIPHSRLLDRH